jgi:hypothetical protein
MFVFFFALGVSLGFSVLESGVVGQQNGVVVNFDTGLSYSGSGCD